MIEADPTARFYLDFSGFHGLRSMARSGSTQAVEQIASQFESIFLQFALKAMRQTSFDDGLLDNDQSRFYQGLLDQQIALTMSVSGKNLGLADVIARQLRAQTGSYGGDNGLGEHPSQRGETQTLKNASTHAVNRYIDVQNLYRADETPKQTETHNAGRGPAIHAPEPGSGEADSDVSAHEIAGSQEAFVRALWPLAERAGEQLGVSPNVLLAQAALETGWGRSVMQRADGTSAHNLFGIKAGGNWHGEQITAHTREVIDGQYISRTAAFRAYDSFAESFDDYVNFLKGNPRYREVLRVADEPEAFAGALQRAGFATDPNYASKIKSIMRSNIAELEPDGAGSAST